MVALAALSVLAVLPLALAGHAAGSASHDTAVNSLAVHLVAAVLWVGGLLGLVVLRPLLGRGLAVSVARYSTLAGWCFVLVALSGVQNAWIRLGSLSALGSPYGVLVLGKVLALGVLGVAGLQQRRLVVGRMATDEEARGLFARLAVVEVVVMGAAFGLATALSRSAPPVPDVVPGRVDPAEALTGYAAPTRPLQPADWLTLWRPDWLWLSVAVVAVGLYLAGVVRLSRRGDRWPVLRAVSWVAGWLIFVWATNGAAGVYGRVLFSAHMTLHMTISMVAPILMVLSAPITLALRTLKPRPDKTLGPREMVLGLVHSRFLRVLANPIVAAALFFGSLVVFYYSPLFELALRTHTGHVLMVIHFLLTGFLFAWVLIGVDPGPPKWSPSLRLRHPVRDHLLPRLLRGRADHRHDAAGPELLRAAAPAVASGPARRPAQRGSGRVGHRRAADAAAGAAGRRCLDPQRLGRDPAPGPSGRPRRRRRAQGLQRAPGGGRRARPEDHHLTGRVTCGSP